MKNIVNDFRVKYNFDYYFSNISIQTSRKTVLYTKLSFINSTHGQTRSVSQLDGTQL